MRNLESLKRGAMVGAKLAFERGPMVRPLFFAALLASPFVGAALLFLGRLILAGSF